MRVTAGGAMEPVEVQRISYNVAIRRNPRPGGVGYTQVRVIQGQVTDDREVRMIRQMTAIIERDGDCYVALCPELDIATQGESVSAARANLKEALELFFEEASAGEVQRRLRDEVYVTHIEVAVV